MKPNGLQALLSKTRENRVNGLIGMASITVLKLWQQLAYIFLLDCCVIDYICVWI